jgi:hypothetical protein
MMLKPNLLTSTATDTLRRTTTVAERAAGRFMRAPDGHEGNGEGAAAAGAGAAAASEGQGDAGKTGEEGASIVNGGGAGDQGAAKSGEEGKGEGEGAAAAGAAGPPDKYELTPPDGFEAIDTEVLAEAEPTLKELNLTNDQAQKLMPLAGQLVKRTMDRAEAAITQRAVDQRKAWAEAFDKDAEIGGANKDATIASAARAFDHYGLKKGEGLRQMLDESGLGNHPDLIRFVAKVGHDLEEGSFDKGDAVTNPKAPEQKLYGPEFQPKG